jgi:hypothetical protein
VSSSIYLPSLSLTIVSILKMGGDRGFALRGRDEPLHS